MKRKVDIEMIPDIGQALCFLSLMLSLCITYMGFFNYKKSIIYTLVCMNFAAIFVAFILLIICFAISDFSVLIVANNSHTLKPLIYKISATWGNHEGSILMWIVILSFFGLLFSFFSKDMRFFKRAIAMQYCIKSLFLMFVLWASNPFARIFPVPLNGMGLNPILQDMGLAMHPPFLYLGYVGFSIAFSASLSAMTSKISAKNFSNVISPFVILSWTFLTIGISLGSWWAYRELGWGGYWFWDPVENASLMPWLASTALMHCLYAQRKYEQFENWTHILCLLTFLLSVCGTFIVRSGIITSVHSFAADPHRGIAILAIFATLGMLGIIVYINRYMKLDFSNLEPFKPLSKPYMIVYNNIILITFLSAVFIGTFYPLFLELSTNMKVSVGVNYFNTFAKFLAFGLVIGYFLHISYDVYKLKNYLKSICYFGISCILLHHFGLSIISIVLISCVVLMCFGIVKAMRQQKLMLRSFIAHFSVGLVIVCITCNAELQKEVSGVLSVNDKLRLGEFSIELRKILVEQKENYVSRKAVLEARYYGKYIGYIEPELKIYPIEKQQTSDAGILHKLLYDLYANISEISEDRVVLRLTLQPCMMLLWFAAACISLSGFLAFINSLKKIRSWQE